MTDELARPTNVPPGHRRYAEWDDQVAEMATSGMTYRAISEATGIPVATVHRMVNRVREEYLKDRYRNRDNAISREAHLLDAMTTRHWRRALNGDPVSVKVVLEAGRDRRKLLGLDAPLTADVTVRTVDAIDAAIEDLSKRFSETEQEADRVDAD